MNLANMEATLLQQAAAGNRQAFSRLYEECLHDCCNYLYLFTRSKETAEDIVQEIFVKLWEQREKLAGIHSFRQYLFRIARNRVIDYIRNQQVRQRVNTLLQHSTETSCAGSDHKALESQYYGIARQAVDQLPEKRRLIFRLSTEEYLSLDEIAGRLNISKSVVKKQLYAANHYVRQYLREHAELVSIVVTLLFS